MSEDSKVTTHPISVDVPHTKVAQDNFDGISYGKGASWLKAAFNLFGREIFLTGLASYFKEFQFKNSTLDDFLRHMSDAGKKLNHPLDFVSWANTWLKTAGCNVIWHDVEEENGKIKKFTVQQRTHKNGDSNRLRVQKYSVGFYDADMNVTYVHDITTKDDAETFDVPELVGKDIPFAYHINYNSHGFGKFVID